MVFATLEGGNSEDCGRFLRGGVLARKVAASRAAAVYNGDGRSRRILDNPTLDGGRAGDGGPGGFGGDAQLHMSMGNLTTLPSVLVKP